MWWRSGACEPEIDIYCLLSQPTWLQISVADVLGFWVAARRPNLRDWELTNHGGHESFHVHPLLLQGAFTTLALTTGERGKKKGDVFNPLDCCCWFSSNKHESVSLIVLYTANICVMRQLSLCVVGISHGRVSASITNKWKCAFVRILYACMSKKESKNLIPKILSHPLIFISEGDQSTSIREDDFSLLG